MEPTPEGPKTVARHIGPREILADRLTHLLQSVNEVKISVGVLRETDNDVSGYTSLIDRLSELQSEVWRLQGNQNLPAPFQETIDFSGPATKLQNGPTNDDPAGRLFGNYILMEELGRGGMGIVYKAWDRKLRRHVAIKIVLGTGVTSPALLHRFQDEAAAAAKLEHGNIVAVHDVGEHEGVAFIVMQWIDGPTLAQRLSRGPIPAREAATCLSVIARTMARAHKASILHLDLKPSNILLDKLGQPHITDFGLAKQFTTDFPALSMGIAGTPKYMSPEQAAGAQIVLTPATDIFSLGTIMYEMLTGRVAFHAGTLKEMLTQLLLHDPLAPRSIDSSIDPELEAICLKCLVKNPEQRYQSADVLADDLENYLRGEPTSVEPAKLHFKVTRLFRATEHADVLKKWGVLWILHSVHVLVLCLLTQGLASRAEVGNGTMLIFWFAMETFWALFLYLRRKRLGKVTAVEGVLNHVWLAGGLGNLIVFFSEWYAELPVLSLAYCLALVGCCIFLIKAGMLSGKFYFIVAILFVCSVAMLSFPSIAMLIFGFTASACFLFPGLYYFRMSHREAASAQAMK